MCDIMRCVMSQCHGIKGGTADERGASAGVDFFNFKDLLKALKQNTLKCRNKWKKHNRSPLIFYIFFLNMSRDCHRRYTKSTKNLFRHGLGWVFPLVLKTALSNIQVSCDLKWHLVDFPLAHSADRAAPMGISSPGTQLTFRICLALCNLLDLICPGFDLYIDLKNK